MTDTFLLHEDANFCKYNAMCEHAFCEFKHQKEEVIPENIESYDLNVDIVTASDKGDYDAEKMNEHESVNSTLSNPSHEDNNTLEKKKNLM